MADKRKVGSYEWRSKDSVRLTVRAGTDPKTSKPIRHTKTVKVKPGDDQAAEKELALFIAAIEKGKYKKPSKMTLKELSERFLRDNANISEETKQNYKIHIEQRILPALGDNKIDRIKPTHIYDFYDNLKEDGIRLDGKTGGLGPATIQKIHHILSSMFSYAISIEELEDNPCEKVKPPKIPKRKPVSLDKDPARELLNALANESLKYRVITLLGATTGMRRGEILGIGDKTLDLQKCIIYIEHASRHRPGEEIRLKDPKNTSSIRAVPFPPSLVPLLKEMIEARNIQRAKCGNKWVSKINVQDRMVDNDLLFIQWNGKPMHPNTVVTWFKKFKTENGFPDNLTFHGLRHTNITLLLKSGVDVGTVADNAGHAVKSTTLAYDDSLPSAQREIASKMDEVLDLDKTIPKLLGKPVNVRRKRVKKIPDQD